MILITLSVFLLISNTRSQIKPKEKTPEGNEMDEMMKNAQKALDNMSPEDKKAMEDMGVKMPSMNNIPKVTDQQLQNANNKTASTVQKKDLSRISKVSSAIISDAGMSAHIEKIQTLVSNKMKPDYKAKAEEIYQLLSQNNSSPAFVGQTAIAFLMEGKPMLALYLLGKACNKLPDADNLNNYAAVLTNFGAEQLSLPILNNLNSHYPKNSTILNNIGQAWFGLGDIEKANKYIDSTIRIYAYHPQANFTKCLIEESKGHIAEAVEAAKRSIKYGYSDKKADKLEKLGYKLKSEDLNWDAPMQKDGLGLTKFKWPAYPKNIGESELFKSEWEEFTNQCNVKISELESQQAILEKQMLSEQQIRAIDIFQASQNGSSASLYPELAGKAFIKLAPLVKGIDAVNNYVFADRFQSVLDCNEEIEKMQIEEEEKIKNIDPSNCQAINEVHNTFLNDANSKMEQREKSYLNYMIGQTDNLLYYRKYTQWPDEYAWTTVVAQISWLTQISRQKVMFRSAICMPAEKDSNPKIDSLQNFDDVACKYISTTDLGCFTITSQCSRLIGKFDCGGVTINVKKNDETERFCGNIYAGASKSVSVGKGPLSAEAELTAAVGIELSESGKTDFVGKVGANINVAGQTVVGMEGRASVNSGPRVSGQGMLDGLEK
jgi:tetratricopeptide (TPR) repeat protein